MLCLPRCPQKLKHGRGRQGPSRRTIDDWFADATPPALGRNDLLACKLFWRVMERSPMKLFLFPSDNLHHIALGIEAKRWAVSEGKVSKQARITKAKRNFRQGAVGLFYCSADRTFRTPFRVVSEAHL